MKTVLITLFILFFSCETTEAEKEFTLEGSWEITERSTFSILENAVVWRKLPENERYVLAFMDSNIVEATNRDCTGSYFLSEIEGLTLRIDFECTEENLLYLVNTERFDERELILADIGENAPDEGLTLKLKRI